MAITAKIVGNKLVIEADLETPKPSVSGKTHLVASSQGFMTTEAKLKDGRTISLNLTATVKPTA